MLDATYILRPWLKALLPIALCAWVLLASSAAQAMICLMDEALVDDSGASSTPLSTPLSTPGDKASLAEFRAPLLPPTQACTGFDAPECQWSFPEGAPQPSHNLSIHRPLAARESDAVSLHRPSLIAQATLTHDDHDQEAYRARVFRPPRAL